MWKIIGIPLLLYLIFVLYIYQPAKSAPIPIAELIKQMPIDTVELYIKTHAKLAVQEMQRAKIPASITLGQAVLESKYGTSELALQANNHFGIKSEAQWDSSDRHCIYSYEWSEKKQRMYPVLSCFRQYASIQDCFRGHSDFLVQRPYYTELFTLDIADFEAWAHGLQKAGYATDPNYAAKLIAIINRYQLQKYDTQEFVH
ncbi:glycoside hydrolase family 73 protein [Aureispira anguillae]|uniref:Glucosaminidase domain-containing protein n=1 Tax=Aureispira anguillae TaxID=2864201 RepID=A0A916DTZ5_9BACT|nr:glucosaminidase domain-containing protein [Aureispira anguillae]BDS12921.1 glucosaminidase domain-containing protein [Aureispira anguillae]